MPTWFCASLIALTAASSPLPSIAQSQPTDIVLRGILPPSDVTTTLAAECFSTRFEVSMATDEMGNSKLIAFTIGGENALSSSSVASANLEISRLYRPYISAVACRDNTRIVFAISGMDKNLKGKDEIIRIFELSLDK